MRRVVSRDGTSQYYLNNGRCRRKDITHILLGTGLGTHGYSIIEQGMISRLVEAKPEEMRAFLEEAAGISKYKERRRETEHRIGHTRENLERLADLRERDREAAHSPAKAGEGRGEVQGNQGRATQNRRRAARVAAERACAPKSPSRSGSSERSSSRSRPRSRPKGPPRRRSRSCASSSPTATSASTPSRAATTASAPRSRGSSSRVQHRKDLIQRQREDLQSTDAQIGEIRSHIASDEVELVADRSAAERARAGPRAGACSSTQLAAGARRRRARDGAMARALGADRRGARCRGALQPSRGHAHRAAHGPGPTARQGTPEARGRTRGLSFAELEERLAVLVANEERLVAACDNAARALETVWQQIQQLREQEKKISLHLDQLREQLQNDRGRLASLEALQEAALGTSSEQINRWLESQALAEKRRLAQDLVVETGWERAVETVLGPYLQAVTIQNMDKVAVTLPELTEGGLSLLEARLRTAGARRRGHAARARQSARTRLRRFSAGIRVAES